MNISYEMSGFNAINLSINFNRVYETMFKKIKSLKFSII
jgi:hypothetical protein